ncbi:Methylthioribose kinase [Symbiodinium microadriaticum]|uniref:Methylthioribose kinase n=1 Tax=Symbiodinium microadriaticum TaxID=2951 RepID=A0A1Q9EQL2_SYMMI|nr:Methylthioribose kinase [Symbiodinium microadriaticum]
MAPSLLTVDTVCSYVSAHLAGIPDAPLSAGSTLTADEVQGGNLNYAFAVRDASGKGVFVKQAPDYIKVLGPDAALTRERMRLEVQVYSEWTRSPGAAAYFPRVWKFDEDSMAFIMELLDSYELLQKHLFQGHVQEAAARSLGDCMAQMHSRTHCSKISAEECQRLSKAYENRLMRDIQLEFVFSKCYREDARAEHLRSDAAFMSLLEVVKEIYNGQNTRNLAVCHGDLHAGSVMVGGESAAVKIIDPEFAIFGPPGLDVGSLLSTYALAYCYHSALKSTCKEELLRAMQVIWETYLGVMKAAGIADDLLKSTEEEAVAFAGCEIARTALGMAYERSLRIEDDVVKAAAEKSALAVGVACVRQFREGIPALMDALGQFDTGRPSK